MKYVPMNINLSKYFYILRKVNYTPKTFTTVFGGIFSFYCVCVFQKKLFIKEDLKRIN